jgi:hypothetical protein
MPIDMMRARLYLIAMLVLVLAVPSLTYAASGTSKILLNSTSISIQQGSSGQVPYSVSIISGTTWGTTLVIENQAQLQSEGISVSASNPSGDPTFSGTLHISVAQSTTPGNYYIVLAATGDVPSVNNATISVDVTGQYVQPSTSAAASNTPQAQTTTPQQTTTAVSVSKGINPGGAVTNPVATGATSSLPLAVVIILILAGGLLTSMKIRTTYSKFVIVGVVLILLGTAVWLYGDYSGGNFTLAWLGVIAILLGIAVWLFGDHKASVI